MTFFDEFHVEWAADVFGNIPRIQDGFLAPSEAPGHGVTVNEDEIDFVRDLRKAMRHALQRRSSVDLGFDGRYSLTTGH